MTARTPSMLPEPPKEALARAAEGDSAAFGEIVGMMIRYPYTPACRLGGDRIEAEDHVQDVFVRLHRQFDRYDASRPFAPWFRTLAVRTILNNLRRTVPFPVDLREETLVAGEPAAGPSERLRAAMA